ncbi:hypothetical protein DRJ17_00715 [Candidatus Woesearchaeota archaeon]|nr:MAG: hypothetical protein DRJ17_00715 [Candidatus Woesearchaeota archaeon]
MKKEPKNAEGSQRTLVNLYDKRNSSKQLKTVIFTKHVPKFVDLDLKTIGPFKPGDILRTHIDIANLLILKGRAKEFDID